MWIRCNLATRSPNWHRLRLGGSAGAPVRNWRATWDSHPRPSGDLYGAGLSRINAATAQADVARFESDLINFRSITSAWPRV
jgi:hypothetical protein